MDSTDLRSTDGRRWAFLSRFDIEGIEDPEEIYLTRWRIVSTPKFGVYLHCIRHDDGGRPLHDHPWSDYWSLMLCGGYVEELLGGVLRTWKAGTRHRVWGPSPHAIRMLLRSPTWSLVVVGRRARDWGFLTEDGWVAHKTYIERERAKLLAKE